MQEEKKEKEASPDKAKGLEAENEALKQKLSKMEQVNFTEFWQWVETKGSKGKDFSGKGKTGTKGGSGKTKGGDDSGGKSWKGRGKSQKSGGKGGKSKK